MKPQVNWAFYTFRRKSALCDYAIEQVTVSKTDSPVSRFNKANGVYLWISGVVCRMRTSLGKTDALLPWGEVRRLTKRPGCRWGIRAVQTRL